MIPTAVQFTIQGGVEDLWPAYPRIPDPIPPSMIVNGTTLFTESARLTKAKGVATPACCDGESNRWMVGDHVHSGNVVISRRVISRVPWQEVLKMHQAEDAQFVHDVLLFLAPAADKAVVINTPLMRYAYGELQRKWARWADGKGWAHCVDWWPGPVCVRY